MASKHVFRGYVYVSLSVFLITIAKAAIFYRSAIDLSLALSEGTFLSFISANALVAVGAVLSRLFIFHFTHFRLEAQIRRAPGPAVDMAIAVTMELLANHSLRKFSPVSLGKFWLAAVPFFCQHIAQAFRRKVDSLPMASKVPAPEELHRLLAGEVIMVMSFMYFLSIFLRLVFSGKLLLTLFVIELYKATIDACECLFAQFLYIADGDGQGNSPAAFRAGLYAGVAFQGMKVVAPLCALTPGPWRFAEQCKALTAGHADVAATFCLRICNLRRWCRTRKAIQEVLEPPDEEEIPADEICVICRGQMTKETARKLPCGHIYHIECLNRWIGEKPTCPLCLEDIFGALEQVPAREIPQGEDLKAMLVEKLRTIADKLRTMEPDAAAVPA
jgi:hypothetical protein